MGNCNFKTDTGDQTIGISKNQFQYHYVVGRGGFGKVWKVERKKTKQLYALKEMSKTKIISKKSVNSVMNERKLLGQLTHLFIVNVNYAFQDREKLYLIMDLLTGGDLRYHIGLRKRFNEEQTKFFAACILHGLEYVHNKGVLHRDIKPENLVLDEEGYVRITDFGIARLWSPENSQDTSGTPGYMAPEVMCRQNHGVAVDYYALGVICFEFMMGYRPYRGRSRREIRDQILARQVQIKKHEVPEGWSLEAADFVNKLIQRKPINRLGLNGPSEVKRHVWFRNYPWDKLHRKGVPSPYIPKQGDNFDVKHTTAIDPNDTNSDAMRQHQQLLRKREVQGLFSGYHYDENQNNKSMSLTSTGQNLSTAASSHSMAQK